MNLNRAYLYKNSNKQISRDWKQISSNKINHSTGKCNNNRSNILADKQKNQMSIIDKNSPLIQSAKGQYALEYSKAWKAIGLGEF